MSSKRKFTDSESNKKKVIDETTQKLYTTSNEWPIYNHPDGGIIKVTPWGSIRQFKINDETVTKFEDKNFQDYSFTPSFNPLEVDYPQTPQSIQSPIKLSPSDEAEQYVMQGYDNTEMELESLNQQQQQPPQQQQHYNNPQQFHQFQEHENYFGTIDDEYNDNDIIM